MILVCHRDCGDPFTGLLVGRDDGLFDRVGTDGVYHVDVAAMSGAPGWAPTAVSDGE